MYRLYFWNKIPVLYYLIMFVVVCIAILAGLGYMIYLHYVKGYIWAAWTGFEGKNLWDALVLLCTPIFLVILAGIIAYWDRQRQERILTEQFQITTLQYYMDRISESLLHYSEMDDEEADERRVIAQSYTIMALSALDYDRRELVLQFIHGIGINSSVLYKMDVQRINLTENKLLELNMANSKLVQIDMRFSMLWKCDFTNSFLMLIDLRGAIISGVNFSQARLRDVNFEGATLTDVNFEGATIEDTDILKAKVFQNVIMPDGTTLEK